MKMTCNTVNESSFAVAFLDGATLVLDGTAKIGGERRQAFADAKRRLADACAHTDLVEEFELAEALMLAVVQLEKKGLNV